MFVKFSYIGETCSHFKTRIEEYKKSLILLNIYTPPAHAFDSYNLLCLKIIDETNSKLDLKTKETLHINWKKPNLNVQQNHLALTLSL